MKKTVVQQGHQGDVQFKTVVLPKGLKAVNKKPIALGEHSGHQHVVTGDYAMQEDEKGNIYVTVGNAGAVLQHIHETRFKGFASTEVLPKADHHPIHLQPNTSYLFGIHKKYSPFQKVWGKVVD